MVFSGRGADSERGIAIVEFAIALPFLVALFMSVYDVGQVLNQYLLMNEAVHEGARMASGQIDLTQVAEYQQLTADQNCAGGATSGGDSESHQEFHERIMGLVNLQNAWVTGNSVCIKTGLTPGAAAGDQNVYVRAQATYQGLFPLFNGLSISVQAEAPYLY
ncbi:MAG: pilus assembly protein [Bdellovibrionales bacterium]|nr:pilus assembly protein [Bdellovibrionales bacterium]